MLDRLRPSPTTRRIGILVLALIPSAAIAAAGLEVSPIFALDDFSRVRGSEASLVRTEEAVWFQLKTRDLTPGDVATVWICGWNDPSVCVNGPGTCGADPADLELDVRGAFCIWGSGGIVDQKGRLESTGYALARRRQPAEPFYGALKDPLATEFNLVVRTHGAAVEDGLLEQLTSFLGGCEENECVDAQVAIFAGS